MENSEESEQTSEKERLRMRIAVLEESVKSSELECKASRETVLRLVAELDRERKKAASSAAALDSLKVELDALAVGRRSFEMDQETLMERLEASKRVTEAAKRESGCLEKQVEELETKLVSRQRETQASEDKLRTFLKKVSDLLRIKSESATSVTEKDVLQEVEKMKTRLDHVSEELHQQTELQHSGLQRAEVSERQVQNLKERLQSLEAELVTADAHRDGLRHNKQQYEEFVERLSETMMVDAVALDLGFDMRLKLILSRAEQLMKREGAALVESKSLTFNLKRTLKSQKDQLESKGFHVQFLRKKVLELEEEKRCRSATAAEKLEKKLERLQSELRVTKQSNADLKAQLSTSNELKLKVMEQSQTVEEQKKQLEQAEEVKARVQKKLSSVSSDLQGRERQRQEDQRQLSALRRSLAEIALKDRELEDFRMMVSQMLGFDSAALALPNEEIIKFLESLIHAHHHHHHLHHHHPMSAAPWLCPTHQRTPPLHHGSSLDVSTSRSPHPQDPVPF